TLPDDKAPVWYATVPRLPVMVVPFVKVTLVRNEFPTRVLFFNVILPPAFAKTSELFANAASGRAIASRTNKTTRLIYSPPNPVVWNMALGECADRLRQCRSIVQPGKCILGSKSNLARRFLRFSILRAKSCTQAAIRQVYGIRRVPFWCYASGTLVSFTMPPHSHNVAVEQFWGRAVQASHDLARGPGRFRFAPMTRHRHRAPHCQLVR